MKEKLQRCWPEICLAVGILFFAFRELGTFPTIWEDEGLFSIVARSVAEGNGYALPILHESWPFPYILAVGPTVILPVALSIALFGWSVAAARIPMAIYLLLTTIVFYRFTERVSDKWNARWATLLLVTFSAFVNTGKPVLGEIPGFFFLALGLFFLAKNSSGKNSIIGGLLIGLSVVTKLTYGIIFPALVVAWIVAAFQKKWKEVKSLTVTGVMSGLVFLAWRVVESTSRGGFLAELEQYAFAEGGTSFFNVLREYPEQIVRFQYAYFSVLFILFCIGLWSKRRALGPVFWIVATFVILGILYFLNGPGWYRHLLPAHLVLLPFVPLGLRVILTKKFAVGMLLFFAAAQGWWQFTHRGATRITEVDGAIEVLMAEYQETDMVIFSPEVFSQLPRNPHWIFLTRELLNRNDPQFRALPLTQDRHCLPEFRKISYIDQEALGDRIHPVHKRYVFITPPVSCL
jgi:4-amino-4-deoxy-L-arabinose transferase-like glycosyltransferase